MSGFVAYSTTVRRLPAAAISAFAAGRHREKRDRFMQMARVDRKDGLSTTIVAVWVLMARDEHRQFMRTMREIVMEDL